MRCWVGCPRAVEGAQRAVWRAATASAGTGGREEGGLWVVGGERGAKSHMKSSDIFCVWGRVCVAAVLGLFVCGVLQQPRHH